MPKKEPKNTSGPPVVPENWYRCQVYLENKHRFCRQERRKGSNYCGNHQHFFQAQEPNATQRKRIRCPIDPSHYIFEDNLDTHSNICPLAKKRRKQAEQPYYHEHVNTGGHGDLCESSLVGESTREITMTLECAKILALRVLHVHQLLFRSSGHETDTLPAKNVSWSNLHDAISMEDLSEAELKAGIAKAFQTHQAKSGGERHIAQLASLVGHLRKLEVLPPQSAASTGEVSPVTFLEMGAGRGMFGLTAAGVAAANGIPTELVMIERVGARSKADKIFRRLPPKMETNSYLKLDTVKWSRIECDLAHVSLPDMLSEKDEMKGDKKRIVMIAKHLCGAGTDLALKSLESIHERVHSCLLATCCHGLCDWKQYVGRDTIHKIMTTNNLRFGPEHFELMRQWCAGSVACQTTKGGDDQQGVSKDADKGSSFVDDAETEHTVSSFERDASSRVNISAVVASLQLKCGVEGLGRACQRIIDYGRLQYLSEVIFKETSNPSELIHYVPPEVSPQNACLIGRSNRSGPCVNTINT
jgi:tRNA:m4X modification enzyme